MKPDTNSFEAESDALSTHREKCITGASSQSPQATAATGSQEQCEPEATTNPWQPRTTNKPTQPTS